MIRMKDILQEQIDIATIKKICDYWETIPRAVRNKFVADKSNYLSTGYPIDMQQICQNPQDWRFDRQDATILKSILQLPNA